MGTGLVFSLLWCTIFTVRFVSCVTGLRVLLHFHVCARENDFRACKHARLQVLSPGLFRRATAPTPPSAAGDRVAHTALLSPQEKSVATAQMFVTAWVEPTMLSSYVHTTIEQSANSNANVHIVCEATVCTMDEFNQCEALLILS